MGSGTGREGRRGGGRETRDARKRIYSFSREQVKFGNAGSIYVELRVVDG